MRPTSKEIYKKLMAQKPTKMWTTEIWAYAAKCQTTRITDYDHPVKWQGPHVPGTSLEDAQRYCNEHSMGYCRVVSEVTQQNK